MFATATALPATCSAVDARESLGHLGDASGRRFHAVGRLGHAADRGPQAFDHRGDGARHVAELVTAIAADAHREIALPDALRDLLDLEDRLHEPAREEHARAEGGREREHAGEQQIAVGARHRLAFRHQRQHHAHLELAELARHRLDVLARGRAGRAESHLGAAQLGPLLERRRIHGVHGDQAPEALGAGRERHRGHRERPSVARDQVRLRHADRARVRRRVAGPGDHPIVAIEEHDAQRALLCAQRLGVMREGRRVVHLEIGPELRRARDGAVALLEHREVIRGETIRRGRGGLEPRLRRPLEVPGERAVLERQREPRRCRRHAAQDAQQADEECSLHFAGDPITSSTAASLPGATWISRTAAGRRSHHVVSR